MEKLDFKKYFNNEENKYYEPKVIIAILEDILGKSIVEIKNDVNENKVNVTSDQIKQYLENTFSENDPDLKKRVESPNPKRSRELNVLTEQEISEAAQNFADGLRASIYYFEPYTLEYFNRYTNVLRRKVVLLLEIIEKIGNREAAAIQDVLADLDVVLDENGKVLGNDIIRLITPTVYNIRDFNEKISEANTLSTYLTFKISKDSLLRKGILENEIYPFPSLQVKDLDYDYLPGNVKLSKSQRDKLEEEFSRSIDKLTRVLIHL